MDTEAIKKAKEQLDTHLREIINWHNSADPGSSRSGDWVELKCASAEEDSGSDNHAEQRLQRKFSTNKCTHPTQKPRDKRRGRTRLDHWSGSNGGDGHSGNSRFATDNSGDGKPRKKKLMVSLLKDELGFVRLAGSLALHKLLQCCAEKIGLATWQIHSFEVAVAVVFLSGLVAVTSVASTGAVKVLLKELIHVRKAVQAFRTSLSN
jgi:hypothetical protein